LNDSRDNDMLDIFSDINNLTSRLENRLKSGSPSR
jgi:hypothetical protein